MLRNPALIFETRTGPDDGGGAAAGVEPAPVEAAGAGDLGGAVSSGEPAAPPAAPEPAPWSLAREEWEQTQQALQGVSGFLQQAAQANPALFGLQQAPAEPEVEYDPFDPDSVRALIRAEAQQVAQQQVAPWMPAIQAQMQEQGTAASEQLLASFSDLGSFDHEAARQVAEGIYSRAGGQLEPEAAFRMGAEYQAALEKRIAEQAVAAYQEQMKNLNGAPQSPNGGAPAVEGGGFESVQQAVRAVTERHFGH